MIQSLVPLFPDASGRNALLFITGAVALGATLWLAGARFSRSLLATLACIAGGILAYQALHWFNLPLDPMATCVAGALLLGIVGFLSHTLLTSLGMGAIFTLWAALAILASAAVPHFAWPDLASSASLSQYFLDAFHALPLRPAHYLPWCCGIAFLAGVTLGVLWQKFSVLLLWSMTGLTLVLLPALAGLNSRRPSYLNHLPHTPWMQGIILAALIAFGVIFQWAAVPADKTSRPPAPTPQPKPFAKTQFANRPITYSAPVKRPAKPKFTMAMDD